MNIISCVLIDDDVDDHEIFGMALQEMEIQVHCNYFSNPLKALSKLQEGAHIPQFIFLDVNMPYVDGLDCLRKIKEFNHLNECTIFMYSTSNDLQVINRSKALGATDYIVKPTSVQDLRKILATCFERNSVVKVPLS